MRVVSSALEKHWTQTLVRFMIRRSPPSVPLHLFISILKALWVMHWFSLQCSLDFAILIPMARGLQRNPTQKEGHRVATQLLWTVSARSIIQSLSKGKYNYCLTFKDRNRSNHEWSASNFICSATGEVSWWFWDYSSVNALLETRVHAGKCSLRNPALEVTGTASAVRFQV